MSGLFGSSAPPQPTMAATPLPTVPTAPTPPAPMPDSQSPAVMEARRVAQRAQGTLGRQSTTLTTMGRTPTAAPKAAANGTIAGGYSGTTTGGA